MQRRTFAVLLAAGITTAIAAATVLAGSTRAGSFPLCNYGEITLNVAPVLTAPNPTHPGDTITSSGGSWTSCGVPFTGFYKEWLRDGAVISGPTLVVGAPASFTYTVQQADVGHAIRSAVQPCNAESGCYPSFVQSSNAITPTNPPPPPPPPPPPAPVVAQGYVLDPTGVPVPGALVELYRDPVVGPTTSFSPLDSATTDSSGFFVLRSAYTAELQGDAAANGGYVNFDVLGASDAASYFDGVTRKYSAGVWLTPEQAVAEGNSRAPSETLNLQPVADAAPVASGASAPNTPWCWITTKRKTLIATERDSTIVGELLVARDAVGTFSFGAGTEHVSNISVGLNFGSRWRLGAFAHASTGNTSGVSISSVGDDWAHQLRSDFIYAKYRKQTVNPFGDVCSTWYTIEPKEWVGGGIVSGADESQYLHLCLTTYRRWHIRQGPGSTWFRAANKLRTWGGSVNVDLGSGGLGLSAWTGASRWVRYDYSFGTRIYDHYLCGNDDFPSRSSRIFAGG
jgi:hypothetical protein